MTARGTPLDFVKRPYLVQIYQDQFKNIIYTKAAQMGISERLLSEAVWVADQKSCNSLYCFPTSAQLQDFVQARLNPVLAASDYLRGRTDKTNFEKKVEKLGLKRIGKGHVYFRGSQNAKQITSVDADAVYLDERDRFNEDNVPYIEKRTLASALKWRREASTPTLPGFGIDVSYDNSDQRVWQIQCPRCGLWQELDFFVNVDFKKYRVRCSHCRKALKRLGPGKWVITNKKMSDVCHGYKVSGLHNPNTTIREMVKRFKRAKSTGFSALQQFYNQDLGIPFESEGQQLTAEELHACKKEFELPIKASGCFAGVDVGVKIYHCVVLKKMSNGNMRLVWAGGLEHFMGGFNSIESIMHKFKIKLLVIDKRPEQTKVKELIDAFPGRVYAGEYPPNVQFSIQDYHQFDDVKREVRIDRTISLDYLISDIQNLRVELPKNIEAVKDFYKHMTASTRILKRNPQTGREIAQWKNKGDDHFFHAFNYARIAQTRAIINKALLDYYSTPDLQTTAGILDWLNLNTK